MAPPHGDVVQLAAAGGDFVSGQVSLGAGEPAQDHGGDRARERVEINVPNGNWEHIMREQLERHGCPTRNVFFHHIKTNESWCRDHGPAFVLKKGKAGKTAAAVVDWGFNAWGGKYPPFDDDDAVPTKIAREMGLPLFYPKIVMEGGSVEFNGAGTVMTTTQCLLNKNRNPHLSKAEIEQYLKDYYGQKHVVWLGDGIEGDDTDGHIDDLRGSSTRPRS